MISRRILATIFILAILDLVGLLITFIFMKSIFIILLTLNISLITIVIPFVFFFQLGKLPINPKDYYMDIIETEYWHLDKNLLTKMFEMRITNRRNFIFTYLALLTTLALAIVFNLKKVREWFADPYPYYSESLVLVCVIGIIVFVIYSFRLDRDTIRELKALFEAMKTLEESKNKSDESAKSMEKSRAHD